MKNRKIEYDNNIRNNFSYTKNKNDIMRIIKTAKEIIQANIETSGFIEFEYEPRLLETLIQASYVDQYLPLSNFNSKSILVHVFNLTNSQAINHFLDIELQNKLFELYFLTSRNSYSDEFDFTILDWFGQYNNILAALFKIDEEDHDMKRFFRKILSFNLIAVYVNTDERVREILSREIHKMTSKFKISNGQFHSIDPWRRIYYYLFYCLTNFKTENLEHILQELFLLQTEEGTWQKNHLLTLLVIHTLKYTKLISQYPAITQKGVQLAEKYICTKTSGMSVLNSMKTYNSVLYAFFSYYFEGELPLLDLMNNLLEGQNIDGGWSLQPGMLLSDVDTTVFVILTLLAYYRGNSIVLNAIIRGLYFISATSTEEGDCSMYINSNESLPEMIARLIMLYSILPPDLVHQEKRQALLHNLITKLESIQSGNGIFRYAAYSFSDLYCISQAALAIHFLRTSPYTDIDNFENNIINIESKIISYLEDNMNRDGGYSPKNLQFQKSEQQSTCYAVIAYSLLKPDRIYDFAGLSWLLKHVNKSIQSYPEGTGPRPIRYNDLAHGPLFVYLALTISRFASLPKGLPMLTGKVKNPLLTIKTRIKRRG